MTQHFTIVFDWGDTVMRDFDAPGPMAWWPEVAAMPGVGEALQVLAARYPLVLASNAPLSDVGQIAQALARVGLDGYFTACFNMRMLGASKPEPRFFQNLCAALGTMPSACVMVGNDYHNDMEGAKQAGMRTVWYCPKPCAGDFPCADGIIRDMAELPEAVERVTGIVLVT